MNWLLEVSSFSLVTNPCNSNAKALTMGLIIYVVTPFDEREVIDLVLSETIQENARFSGDCIVKWILMHYLVLLIC